MRYDWTVVWADYEAFVVWADYEAFVFWVNYEAFNRSGGTSSFVHPQAAQRINMSFSEKDNEKVLVDSYPPVRVVSASDNATQRVARDIAADLVAELDAGFEVTPEMKRRVLRKIDFILLPLISCTATLSFLDKVSNNYANNVNTSVVA